jgi:hypothetical protein
MNTGIAWFRDHLRLVPNPAGAEAVAAYEAARSGGAPQS